MHVIANRWYAIAASREVSSKAPTALRRFGSDLVAWRRVDGSVAVVVDRCPHRGATLSPGKVVGDCIQCPFHGFSFDGNGACTSVPAHPERPIPKALATPSFEAREGHGLLWLWTGPDPAPETPIPFFDFDGFTHAGSEFCEDVDVHYTRAVENQLDFPHLPFVHETTIGRFAQTELEVDTEVEGDLIRARVRGQDGIIEFLGPNIWRLQVGAMWQFLAFAPVDDTHMRYYVRAYQRSITMPGAAWLFGRIGRVFNRIVLNQDTPVVESQPPHETQLRQPDEVLVPSDQPIIAYRRWREDKRIEFGTARSLVAASDLKRDVGT